MQKFLGIGNIATEIELKYTPKGNAVATFNVAFNDMDDTTFLTIEVWKKQAENVSQYCKKGSQIFIDGRIKVDTWEKDGQKRSRTKVVANYIKFLDRKAERGQPFGNTEQLKAQKENPFEQAGKQIDDSDLPF